MNSADHGAAGEAVEPTFGPPVPSEYYPPPWRLTGEGIILIYRFPRAWVERLECLTDQQRGNFAGGLGYVMMVNYHQSPVGPYKELLLIPASFDRTAVNRSPRSMSILRPAPITGVATGAFLRRRYPCNGTPRVATIGSLWASPPGRGSTAKP